MKNELSFHITSSGKKHYDRIELPNNRFLKFLENNNQKGNNSKFRVIIIDEDKIEQNKGSVSEEEIPITFNSIKQLSQDHPFKIEFLARVDALITNKFRICFDNESDFNMALAGIYEEMY